MITLKTIKPILFNTLMVQAILEGRKTQTRRMLRMPFEVHANGMITKQRGNERLVPYEAPYKVGDTVWVRETWCKLQALDDNESFIDGTERYYYRAGDCPDFDYYLKDDGSHSDVPRWYPSIHMPRDAARLFLKVTNVKIERLKDITEPEALKEGFISTVKLTPKGDDYTGFYAHEHFIDVWDDIYAKQGNGWDFNPWVWVIEFERIKQC